MADDRDEMGGEPEGQGAQAQPQEEERSGGRMDAAKAFFRALHAGGEGPLPEMQISGAEPDLAPSSGPCRNCQGLSSQVGELEQKYGDLENTYKRMMADFENFRRRMEREKEEFAALGVQRGVDAILPALDDMDRALQTLTPEMAVDKVLDSVKLVLSRLTRCLEQVGVKPMSVVGAHFDPKYHEPVQEIETTEVPDGHVVHELRRGYTLNDKVIRPALVNVATNPGPASPASMQEEPEAAGAEGAGAKEEETPIAVSENKTAGGKVYDLSELDDSADTEDNLSKALDGYAEAPASGNKAVDE